MKHNKKINPLTYFNNLKADAIKKAGEEMNNYKKSLTKAQPGIQVGPMTEEQTVKAALSSGANDPMNYGLGPRLNPPTRAEKMDALMKEGSRNVMNSISKLGKQKKGGSVKRKRK